MSKILFTDLDGTLLDDHKQIPLQNRQAIEELLDKGHKIVLTTGRSLPSAMSQAEKLGLTFDGCYVIAFNGGEIYDVYHKRSLYKNRIPIDTVSSIFRLCEEHHVHVQTFDDHFVLSYHLTDALLRYCREIVCEYKIVDDIKKALDKEPSKLLLLDYENHETLSKMQTFILDSVGDIVDAFFSSPGLLEIVPKGTNKGVAVEKLCHILEIPLENSVAIGDGINDIPMIKTAQVGVSMINAVCEVKKASDVVTSLDNNHGGVAEAIHKFILN